LEETIVFIDEGFLDKLSKYFGEGKRLKFDKFCLAKNLAKKRGLFCKKLFYYTAPPFQSGFPSEDEKQKKAGHDKFIRSLSSNKDIVVREGRCQRTFGKNGNPVYKQKGVDTLLTIDLGHLKEDYPNIKKIVLVSSDTDFCPAIMDIKERGNIEVILYTYFDRQRGSKFSLSNELIKCCSVYCKLEKQDFEVCQYDSREKSI